MSDTITWPEILRLLNMDIANFRDQAEMDTGFRFMQDQIELHGKDWI